MDNEKFGKFIAELRKEKNMTQIELANKLNITDKAISKWERGLSFPDISMLKPLAELFNVSILELINGQRDKTQEINIDERIIEILKQNEREKKKKIRKVIIKSVLVFITLFIILLILAISKAEMHTYNPIRAIIGYIQVKTFNTEHVEVGNIPTKTIYANSDFDIEKYMLDKGFAKIKGYSIKAGDDFYTDGQKIVFIEKFCRRNVYMYEWGKMQPYNDGDIEKYKLETEIKTPTLDSNNIINLNINNLLNEVAQ